jgi:hypothetical protein
MSLFFIRFMDRTTKNGVTIMSQARFRRRENSTLPRARALVNVTALVRGRKSWATTCRNSGIAVKGKKVLLRRNMGVMKRKFG